MLEKLLTLDEGTEFEKKVKRINCNMRDMADAFACAIPIIQKFNSEMQQFTDSIAPPIDASIDGSTVEARILPDKRKRSEKPCSKS